MRYYCKALQGESDYNICINCDMTVTCNCQDWGGAGRLGDLRRQSFEEIFSGEKAQSFRESLLGGNFPISVLIDSDEFKDKLHKGGAETWA